MGGHRDAAEEGGDVDDLSAAALEKVFRGGLHAVERRLHVDGHHLVDVVVGEVEHVAGDAAAGVVDPDVVAAELGDRRRAQGVDVGALRDVSDDDDGACRAALERLGGNAVERLLSARGEYKVVSVGGEPSGHLGADSRAGARDDDRLVRPVQLVRHLKRR
jgi:hypothetical protein